MRVDCWRKIGAILGVDIVFLAAAACAAAAEPAEASFPMKEARPDLARADTFSLLRGQAVILQTEPPAEVKKWPKLRAKRPLYGTAHFDRDLQNPLGGITMHFVLDESGDAPAPPSEKPKAAKGDKPANWSCNVSKTGKILSCSYTFRPGEYKYTLNVRDGNIDLPPLDPYIVNIE